LHLLHQHRHRHRRANQPGQLLHCHHYFRIQLTHQSFLALLKHLSHDHFLMFHLHRIRLLLG
jgi:hypothetical protein